MRNNTNMKDSLNSAIKDPFIRDMIKGATIIVAVVVAAIGIKTLRNYFKKK
jgi:hypothetical protein